jgi:hypothetical protein
LWSRIYADANLGSDTKTHIIFSLESVLNIGPHIGYIFKFITRGSYGHVLLTCESRFIEPLHITAYDTFLSPRTITKQIMYYIPGNIIV